jgi:hypothetical protein
MKIRSSFLFLGVFLSCAQLFAAEDTFVSIRAYWSVSQGESMVSIVGEAAKAMYNSQRAENFSNDIAVDAKKIDGFVCAEIAKQPGYDDIRNSWLISIVGFVPLTSEYKLYRDIQTQSYICTNLVGY